MNLLDLKILDIPCSRFSANADAMHLTSPHSLLLPHIYNSAHLSALVVVVDSRLRFSELECDF